MDRKLVSTDGAPAAIGPYSQAVTAGELVFCSGQIALDPASGAMVDDDVSCETRRALDNLAAVLEAAGSSLARVVKCTIYLLDMSDFARVNEIYGGYFGDQPPARACVAVAGLPKGARVEIEAIALRG